MKKSTVIILIVVFVILVLCIGGGIIGAIVLSKSVQQNSSTQSTPPTNSNLAAITTDEYEFYYPNYYKSFESSGSNSTVHRYLNNEKNSIGGNNNIILLKGKMDISNQEKCTKFAQDAIKSFSGGPDVIIKLEGSPKFEESNLFHICRFKASASTPDGTLLINDVASEYKNIGSGYVLTVNYDEKTVESEIKDLTDAYDAFKVK